MWINHYKKLFGFSSQLLENVIGKCKFSVVPKVSGQTIGKKRFRLEVENDIQKLINYCCGANYYKNGDEIKLKEDKEYPDWLWKLPLKPLKLHELDQNTKEYWEKAAIVGQQREWKLRKITNKRHMIVNPKYLEKLELKYRRRFRALAKYHYNAGSDIVQYHERDDIWNMHLKEKYYLPDEPDKPFYPGIDTVNLNHKVASSMKYRKKIQKAGHFGQ